MSILMTEILQVAHEAKASDVHITIGLPPVMRVYGRLVKMNFPVLTADDTMNLAMQVMTPSQKDTFMEVGEYDMSVAVPGLGRYRLNTFMQRGAVAMALRTVSIGIPTTESLNVPPAVVELQHKKKRLSTCNRPYR